jgi:hypothetical protein
VSLFAPGEAGDPVMAMASKLTASPTLAQTASSKVPKQVFSDDFATLTGYESFNGEWTTDGITARVKNPDPGAPAKAHDDRHREISSTSALPMMRRFTASAHGEHQGLHRFAQ